MEHSVTTVRFNGDNWTTWKFQTQIILKSKGLFDIITGKTKKPETDTNGDWAKKDANAQEIIAVRMEEKPLTHIISCQTACEMWDKLMSIFEQKSQVSIHLLQQRFFSLEFKEGSVAGFISQLEEIQSNLKQLGEEISDKMVMTKILMSLPDYLKHFVSAWESTESAKQTLKELTSRLLIEEERIKQNEHVVALAAGKMDNKGQKEIKCFSCNRVGHIIRNCPNKRRNNSKKYCPYCKKQGHVIKECWFKKRKEGNSDEVSNAFITSVKIGSDSKSIALFGDASFTTTDWCLDSGASDHMCFDSRQFISIDHSITKLIEMGDGSSVKATGIGNVRVYAWNGKEWIKTTLYDVLYVPEFKINLFSMPKVLDRGFLLKSDKNKSEIIDKNGNVRAIAKRHCKFFKMFFKSNLQSEISSCNFAESLNDWHCKLVHVNFDRVKSILKKNNISYNEDNKVVCENCLLGKQHRLSFTNSESKTEKIGQLIHADLCGPFEVESIGGTKYYLLIKDDYSNYRVVYFLKYKSEAKQKINHFINFLETQTGNKVMSLRTDNGLEFINNDLEKLLSQHGIKHERTCAYTPEQNGRAERDNRTLVEAARTMIYHKHLDKKFWAEAINTAVFVMNRIGISRYTDKTPFYLWYKKDYDISFFKIFGSKVAAHIPKQKRHKLDAKSKTGILVGYSENVKGYRVYFPKNNKVEILRDIIILPEIQQEKEKKGKAKESVITLDMLPEHGYFFEMGNQEEKEKEQEEKKEETVNLLPEPGIVAEDGNQEEIVPEIPEAEEQNSSDDNLNENIQLDVDEENVTKLTENIEVNRRGRRIKKPSWMQDYDLNTSFFSQLEEPVSYEDVISKNSASEWEEAMNKELYVLKKNNTWTEVPWPANKKVIESKWVFKVKNDGQYKARLVARGFQQEEENSNSYDIYAPVAKLCTFRILLVLASKLNLPVFHMDVESAFLYGDITDEVYMSLPGKTKYNSKTVCKLNKSIYGLKKSPKCWNIKFNTVMEKENFVRSQNDFCLYIKNVNNIKLYVLLYVDDVLILGTNLLEVERLKVILNNNFSMKDLGTVSSYLGINVKQNINSGYIELDQSDYLRQVLKNHGMIDCNPVSTPIDNNFNFALLNCPNPNEKLIKICRKIIGSLMYAVTGTRPDLCESVTYLSRFQDKANDDLLKCLKRVLRYIKSTLNFKLIFKPNLNVDYLHGYVDSDWGGDVLDRKSTTGYIFKLFNCTISWASKKQQNVSISSTESEYTALSIAISEACWLKKILTDFNIFKLNQAITIFEDNQSAIKIANNPENNRRIKHIDIKHHFIKEKIDTGLVKILHIKTNYQLADIFTKPLPKIKFTKFANQLGLK